MADHVSAIFIFKYFLFVIKITSKTSQRLYNDIVTEHNKTFNINFKFGGSKNGNEKNS